MASLKNNTAGFTLLETLVSLAVLAISLGVVYQVFSSAMQGTALASDYAKASMYADSHLAKIGNSVHFLSGETNGIYNKHYHWSLLVQALDQADSSDLIDEKIQEYKIVLDVFWKSGHKKRSIRATTYRLSGAL